MSISKNMKYESRSRQTTEEDSNSDRDEEFFILKTNPAKHKTELCKTFSELGSCPYQRRCRFAHGKHELVKQQVFVTSKNRKCNGFWKNGCCPYGMRCQFGHSETKWEDFAILLGLEAACHPPAPKPSKLMRLLN